LDQTRAVKANVQWVFTYDGMPVGHFVDVPEYPTRAGVYAYMPYRSPGHLAFFEECARSGEATCRYELPGGAFASFTARTTAAVRAIEVMEIATSAAYRPSP
jgi:hypothetical protein